MSLSYEGDPFSQEFFPLNAQELRRYSRQIMLPEIGLAGQQRLLASHALIVGLGGLGSPVAIYLAAAGVGHLMLVDPDRVELSNLQRQVIHGSADIGRPKVESARDGVLRLNPTTRVKTIAQGFDKEAMLAEVANADVVLDTSDNFDTRFAVNKACVNTGTPLVSGAATGFHGEVSVFDRRLKASPCYRCLYGEDAAGGENCISAGVIAPLLGIIGATQALEAIKLLVGRGEGLHGRVLRLDGLKIQWRSTLLRRDPACPVCVRV
ncbi:MAG: HesA/MoeB/ThiF family protein [Gammaproteobacteria bacterium]